MNMQDVRKAGMEAKWNKISPLHCEGKDVVCYYLTHDGQPFFVGWSRRLGDTLKIHNIGILSTKTNHTTAHWAATPSLQTLQRLVRSGEVIGVEVVECEDISHVPYARYARERDAINCKECQPQIS